MATKKTPRQKLAARKKKLLSAGAAVAAAVREWPKLDVFTEGESAKARKMVTNSYGRAFASKASDRLCQALSTVRSFGLESVSARSPRPTIVECTPPEAPASEVRNRAVTLGGAVESIAPSMLLLARRHVLRDRFAKYAAPFITHLEGQSRHIFPAGLEATA